MCIVLNEEIDVFDSFQFLSTSLEKLVHNLAKEGAEKFKHLRQYTKQKHQRCIREKLELLMRKGVYPYEYMDSKNNSIKLVFQMDYHFTVALATKAYQNNMSMPTMCGNVSDIKMGKCSLYGN